MPSVATLDFHVTSRCLQSCPFCAPPELSSDELDTQRAAAVVRKTRALGVPRIVFTGGDPLLRPDAGLLLRVARQERLEAELATPGGKLTPGFLRAYGRWIDRLALPLDGPRRGRLQPHQVARPLRGDPAPPAHCWPTFPPSTSRSARPSRLTTWKPSPNSLALLDRLAPTLPNRLALDIYQRPPADSTPPAPESR